MASGIGLCTHRFYYFKRDWFVHNAALQCPQSWLPVVNHSSDRSCLCLVNRSHVALKADCANLGAKINNLFTAKHTSYTVAPPHGINKLCKRNCIVCENANCCPLDCTQCFPIFHYAGLVTYTMKEFLLKSRDHIGDREQALQQFKWSICESNAQWWWGSLSKIIDGGLVLFGFHSSIH